MPLVNFVITENISEVFQIVTFLVTAQKYTYIYFVGYLATVTAMNTADCATQADWLRSDTRKSAISNRGLVKDFVKLKIHTYSYFGEISLVTVYIQLLSSPKVVSTNPPLCSQHLLSALLLHAMEACTTITAHAYTPTHALQCI